MAMTTAAASVHSAASLANFDPVCIVFSDRYLNVAGLFVDSA